MPTLADDLDLLRLAAMAAGDVALAYFRSGQATSATISYKAGNSPVSEADHAANEVLEYQLRQQRPGYAWISEETADNSERLSASHVFIADPIDGTRAFIAGKPEWCVSVALVVNGKPVAGVIHAPSLGLTYTAMQGGGAFCNGERIAISRQPGLENALCAGPKSLIEQLEKQRAIVIRQMPRVPSLALRLAYAAAGKADMALATTGAHDWDVAAADILLSEAGGLLMELDQQPLVYNQATLGRGILCAGPAVLAAEAAQALGLRR